MCDCFPVDEAGLLAELRDLHRGRGIRRVAVRAWLGPLLREAAGIDQAMSDETARSRLVDLLREKTAAFPRDLRYLFEVASGIAIDRPFLEDRLALAEKALDRSQRVLRRRLREAERLLADSLLPGTTDVVADRFDLRGWEWVTQDYHLSFDPVPVFTVARTVRALHKPLTSMREMFIFPHPAADSEVLRVEAVSGCRSTEVQRESGTGWSLGWELDEPLPPGQTHDMVVRLIPPGLHVLAPVVGIGPLRPMRRLRLTVDFGDPPVATSAWRLDGAMSSLLLAYTEGSQRYDPAVTRVVTAEFDNPRVGLMYALAWEWAPGVWPGPGAPVPRA